MALNPGDGAQFWLYIFPPFRLLEFAAGCVLALLIRSGWRSPVSLPAAALSAGVVYLVLTTGNRLGAALGNGVEDAVMLPLILLVISSAATASLNGAGQFLSQPGWSGWGSGPSPCTSRTGFSSKWPSTWTPLSKARPVPFQLAEGFLFIVVALAVAGVAYTWFEKPLEKRLRGGGRRREPLPEESRRWRRTARAPWRRERAQ